jgi:hypothetical protein
MDLSSHIISFIAGAGIVALIATGIVCVFVLRGCALDTSLPEGMVLDGAWKAF